MQNPFTRTPQLESNYRSAKKIGIVVARFQIDELTNGHTNVLRHVLKVCDILVVILGTSDTRLTTKNPLPFEARKHAVLEDFPSAMVLPIPDHKSDEVWVQSLDSLLDTFSQGKEVILFGCRDSFLSCYSGKYNTQDLANLEVPGVSATKIRKSIFNTIENDPAWRRGVIWASGNKWPIMYPTVDIAILHRTQRMSDLKVSVQVLLARKSGEKGYRFPGGFVDPTDENLEQAAQREAAEECGGIRTEDYEYVSSFHLHDWRYRGTNDAVMTTLFTCNFVAGNPQPTDDISELEWVFLDDITDDQVEPVHRPLIAALKKHIEHKSILSVPGK